jgi:uncharacterized membrane protein YcaP (DUF421 family)
MDPFRIAIRSLTAFIFLLVLLRLSGKRTIYQGSPFDFVLALVLGDMIDDVLWQEVPIVQFMVGTATLAVTKLTLTLHKGRARS